MTYRCTGLELDPGGHGTLQIKPPTFKAPLLQMGVHLVDGLWRITEQQGNNGATDGTIFVLPWSDAPSRHPDLCAEIFIIEGKERSGTTALTINGTKSLEVYAVRAEGMLGQQHDQILHGQVGTIWLRFGGGALPIAILPRHFFMEDAPDEKAVRSAVLRLRQMVEDLWRESVSGTLLHRAEGKEQGGISIQDGHKEASWWQRLARIEDLLHHQGVTEAWQALLADPVIHLDIHRPVVPIYKARRAEVGGSRGPWTLPQGWSPHRPAGQVRDRRVVRTVDTPPNRLAVALAELVCRELDDIQLLMGEGAPESLRRLCGRLRLAGEEVLSAPRFAAVQRGTLPALDSPSLQLNTRCRALLLAWDRIHTEASLEVDLRHEHAMQEPIARAELLYERWCFVRLCQLLRDRGLKGTYVTNGALLSYEGRLDNVTVTVVYSADNSLKTDDRRLQRFSHQGKTQIESFSLVSKPDGMILTEHKGKRQVHIWDAKYRRLTVGRFGSSDLYQAHAFRDALWVGGIKPSWSIVLHPWIGEKGIEEHRYPVTGRTSGAAKPVTSSDVSEGGVGIFCTTPSEDGSSSDGPLSRFVTDLLSVLKS